MEKIPNAVYTRELRKEAVKMITEALPKGHTNLGDLLKSGRRSPYKTLEGVNSMVPVFHWHHILELD